MRFSMYTLTFAVVILVLAVRCTNPASPVNPSTGGVLYGNVRAIDKYLNPDTNVAGIRVIVASSAWSDSTVTNRDGSWRLANVPLGIFSVSVVKTGAERSVLTGVQFVGSDSLLISPIYVKEPLATDFVSSARVETFYRYRHDIENPSRILDSTEAAFVTITTDNRTSEGLWFSATLNSDDDCSAFIASSGCYRLSIDGKTQKFEMDLLLDQLREYYGVKDLSGKRLFLQIRPWSVSHPGSTCHPPLVVPFNL